MRNHRQACMWAAMALVSSVTFIAAFLTAGWLRDQGGFYWETLAAAIVCGISLVSTIMSSLLLAEKAR